MSTIKQEISHILRDALSGQDASLRFEGYIRWGLVEERIHAAIDAIFARVETAERELATQREINRLRVPGSCQCGDDDLCAIARERDELRKDKERLDWLETNACSVEYNDPDECPAHFEVLGWGRCMGECREHLRDAIDAARTAQRGGAS